MNSNDWFDYSKEKMTIDDFRISWKLNKKIQKKSDNCVQRSEIKRPSNNTQLYINKTNDQFLSLGPNLIT